MADDITEAQETGCACDGGCDGECVGECGECAEPVAAEMIAVRVIRAQGPAVLVQWTDGDDLRRAYVPAREVLDGQVSSETLAAGIPYGLLWEEIVAFSVTPERLARELRRRGVWTTEDVLRQPNSIVAALQAAYRIDLAAIQGAAREAMRDD